MSSTYLDLMRKYILKCMRNRTKEIDFSYFTDVNWEEDTSCTKDEFFEVLTLALTDIYKNYLVNEDIDKEIVKEIIIFLKSNHITNKRKATEVKGEFYTSLLKYLDKKFIYKINLSNDSTLIFVCSEMYRINDIIELAWDEYKEELKDDKVYNKAITGIIQNLACIKACSQIYKTHFNINDYISDSDIINQDSDIEDKIENLTKSIISYFYTDSLNKEAIKIAKECLKTSVNLKEVDGYDKRLNSLKSSYIKDDYSITVFDSQIYTHPKFIDIVQKSLQEDEIREYEKTQNVSEKERTIMNKKVSKEVVKNFEDTDSQAYMVQVGALLQNPELRGAIDIIFNYLAQLLEKDENVVSSKKKDEIVATLAGNSEYLLVFLSKLFVKTYLAFVFKLKDSNVLLDALKSQGLNHFAFIIEHTSLEKATELFLTTMASCSKATQEKIPTTLAEIRLKINDVLKFDTMKTDISFKRKKKQELIFVDDDSNLSPEEIELRKKDEEKLQAYLDALKDREERYGSAYLEVIKEKQKQFKLLNMTKLEGADDDIVEDASQAEDWNMVRKEIRPTVNTIMDYYKNAFDIIIKMRKFVGTYIFKEHDKDDSYGLLEIDNSSRDSDTVSLRTVRAEASALLAWLDDDYKYPIKDILRTARHNQVPSLYNIKVEGYNYYPVFVTRYALGFVKGKKYTKFDEFIGELQKDVQDRLYKIYKEKVVIEGKEYRGRDLFSAKNVKDNNLLIGAFVNSVIFLSGNNAESYDNAQIRCICSIPHKNDAHTYTDFETDGYTVKGLSDVVDVKYLFVNNTNSQNILDILYLRDKELFYNSPAWAFRELGNVYGTGDVPSISKGEKVVIGRQLSGELVDFGLGSNAAFVTSIYAGSRSGKGVTTLSILAAIMASRIPISYLDCKPDMANCFWEMENKASAYGLLGHTYAYDVKADTVRLENYSTISSLYKQTSSKSSELANSNIASAIFILKNLQLMLLTGVFRQKKNNTSDFVWVIDEINNMSNLLNNAYTELTRLSKLKDKDVYDKNKELKERKQIESEDKHYAEEVLKYWGKIQTALATGVNDIFGQCGYKFIIIGQDPIPLVKGNKPSGSVVSGNDILQIIAKAGCNRYFVGRGLSEIDSFGSKAFNRNRSDDEVNALEEYKYFLMRNTTANGVTGYSASSEVLFQPFLTLNSDDVLRGCWTGGVGRTQFGYDSRIKKGSDGYEEMVMNYKVKANQNLGSIELSDNVLNSADIGTGVVDEGTGFYGLVKMYCSKDSDPDATVLNTALSAYRDLDKILRDRNLIGENSFYGYQSIEDYLYDFSVEGMEVINFADYEKKLEAFNKYGNSFNSASNSGVNIDFNDTPSENDGTPKSSNLQETNSDTSQLSSEEMRKQAEILVKEEEQALREQEQAEKLSENLKRKEEEELRKQQELESRKAEAEEKLEISKLRVSEANERKIALDELNRYSKDIDKFYKVLNSIKQHVERVELKNVLMQQLLLTRENLNAYIEILNGYASNIVNNKFEYRLDGEVYTFDSLRNQRDSDFINKTHNRLLKLIEDLNYYIKKITEIESLYNEFQNGGDESQLNLMYSNVSNLNDIVNDTKQSSLLNAEYENQKSLSDNYTKELEDINQESLAINTELQNSNDSVESIRKEAEEAKQRASEASSTVNDIKQKQDELAQRQSEFNASNSNNSSNQNGNQMTFDNDKSNNAFSSGQSSSNNNNNSGQSFTNDSNNSGQSFFQGDNGGFVKTKADARVGMTQGSEEYASKTDSNGNVSIKDVTYVESIIRKEIPYLNERLYKTNRFKFIDKAMVKQNQKDRYKIFITAVEDSVGWAKVTQLTMTASEIIINRNEKKINVQALGDNDYNIYEVMDFADLFFKKAKRLHTLRLDNEVSEIIVAECGGDIYESLFNTTPTLHKIFIDKLEINKHNRTASMEMALKAEVEKAEAKSKAKDAIAESLFASGKVNQTSENMAIAKRITRRAEKSGRKTQTNKGLIAAQKLGQMTLPQLALAGVAGVFLGIGTAINLLRGKK